MTRQGKGSYKARDHSETSGLRPLRGLLYIAACRQQHRFSTAGLHAHTGREARQAEPCMRLAIDYGPHSPWGHGAQKQQFHSV